jgi:photosystem II stability/assembly factor-like uncharacterized protein
MITNFGKYERPLRLGVTVTTSLIPLAVVGGLLYAAFFVKASGTVAAIKPPAIERRDTFLGAAVPADGIIWAAGSNGKVIRSDDHGAHWQVQPVPVGENLQGIAAWDATQAVAVGGGGVVLRTVDGGKHWREVAVPKSEVANKLLTVRAYANGAAWAVGELGAVLGTTDYGQSWQRAFPEKDQAWNDISFFGDHGILVGEFGQVMCTDDGGKTWRPAKSGTESSLMSVYLRDASNAVAVGLSGVILVTHDGGAQWSVAQRPTIEHLNGVIWDGARWKAVGDKGVIVTGDANGAAWSAARVSEGNLGWNTQILRADAKANSEHYILAGASLARLDGGKFSVFGRAAD